MCSSITNLGTICSIHRQELGTKQRKWTIREQCVPFTDRNSEQNSPKWPNWKQCGPLTDIGTRTKTVLIYQFENGVFRLQIRGTQNKTVPIYQFGNSVFHSQIGTRNKAVLICQFGNSLFYQQIQELRPKQSYFTNLGTVYSIYRQELHDRNTLKSTDEGMIPITIHHLQFGRKKIKMSVSFNGVNTQPARYMGYYCTFYSCRIDFYICVKGRNLLRMFGGVKSRV